MSKRPHIIIFNPDQWRWDVQGHMGNPAAVTPVLDAWVRNDAVSFRHAYCQNPVCTPSRCSFMTGWYPHVRGHRTMHHMLRPDEPVLLKRLKDEGYFVWWGGKNDLVPAQNGYEDFCDVKYQPDRKIHPMFRSKPEAEFRGAPDGDNYYSFYFGKLDHSEGDDCYYDKDWANVHGAVDLIKNYDGEKPLCIYLPLTYPHPPYAVEDPWYSQIDRSKLPPRTPEPADWSKKPSALKGLFDLMRLGSWTEDRWDELRATYYGMCARVDHQLGLVLDALKEAQRYDDSAVFFFSDHGDYTGDYSIVEKTQNTFEDVLGRVPFVVKPPKNTPVKPRVSDAMVELIDFPATVEALAGLPPTHTHFGQSLLPVLAGETDDHRDAVFCEGGRRQDEEHCKEKQSGIKKDNLYGPRMQVQHSDGPMHTKATMCRTRDFKYVRRMYESDELYDMRNDPHEQHNLIDDPAQADALAALKERMLTFYQETADAVPLEADRRG